MFSALATVSPMSKQCEGGTRGLTTCFSRCTLVGCEIRIRVRCFVALSRFLPRLHTLAAKRGGRTLQGVCHRFSIRSTAHVGRVRDIAGRSMGTIRCFVGRGFSLLSLRRCGRFVRFKLASRSVGGASIPLSVGSTLGRICFPNLRRIVSVLGGCTRS